MDKAGWITLAAGDVVELADACGATLIVQRGMLWITQQRDARDIALNAGDSWTVERNGSTLVGARSDAVLAIVGRSVATVRRMRAGPTLRQRVARMLRGLMRQALTRRHVPYV